MSCAVQRAWASANIGTSRMGVPTYRIRSRQPLRIQSAFFGAVFGTAGTVCGGEKAVTCCICAASRFRYFEQKINATYSALALRYTEARLKQSRPLTRSGLAKNAGNKPLARAFQAELGPTGHQRFGTVGAYNCHNYYGINKHLPIYSQALPHLPPRRPHAVFCLRFRRFGLSQGRFHPL